jgi:SAM-dependent methyltransferase
MKTAEWLALLRCPVDGGELSAGEVPEPLTRARGALTCARCATRYPVEGGIVRFLDVSPTTKLDHDDKERERRARDAGSATYDERFPRDRVVLELEPSLREIRAKPGDVIAELGCGTGRFTRRVAPDVRAITALDLSLASLERLRRQLEEDGIDNVLLAQADITRPPLARGAFTRAISMQVFEHLPSAEDRARAFAAAASLLAPGAELVASMYNWSRWKQFDAARGRGDNTRKEGYHATTPPIYYYNFEAAEVRALVQNAGLAVERMRGVLLQVPGLLALGAWGARIHEALADTDFGRRHGHLLLVRARK